VQALKREEIRDKYMKDPQLCQALLDKLPFKVEGFCRVCTLKPSKDGGYIQLSTEGANKFAMLQEVILWSSGVFLMEPDDQSSHRCHKPLCLEKHVCVESTEDNNRRKGCIVVFQCKHCALWYLVCPHLPSCIKEVSGFTSWDDFLQNGLHP